MIPFVSGVECESTTGELSGNEENYRYIAIFVISVIDVVIAS